MAVESGQQDAESSGHRTHWFAPDRPVAGTVYVKPEPDGEKPAEPTSLLSS